MICLLYKVLCRRIVDNSHMITVSDIITHLYSEITITKYKYGREQSCNDCSRYKNLSILSITMVNKRIAKKSQVIAFH